MSLAQMVDRLSAAAPDLLSAMLGATVKGAAIIAIVALFALGMRRASAAARHLVWFLGVLSLLLLPALSATLPHGLILPAPPVKQVRPQPEDVAPAPMAASGKTVEPAEPVAQSAPPQAQPTTKAEATTTKPEPPPTVAVRHASETHVAAAPTPTQSAPWPTVPARPSLPARMNWQAWFVLAWGAGSTLLLGYLALGHFSLWLLLRRSSPVTDLRWLVLVRRYRMEVLGMLRPVEVFSSPDRTMPMTWGWWRVRLLLPADFVHWTDDERQTVLLHELAHAKRRDCLTQFVAQLACAAYWLNPLVWLAWRRMQAEREVACDDLVLSTGARPSAYAEQLLRIATRAANPRGNPFAVAVARPGTLEGRVRAILDSSRSRGRVTAGSVLLAMLLAAVVAIGIAMVWSQKPVADDKVAAEAALFLPRGFGRVVDAQSQPVIGAKLACSQPKWSASSGTEGLFDLRSLMSKATPATDQFELTVRAPGFLDREFNLTTHETSPQARVIRLYHPGRVEGRLIGANGRPIAAVKVAIDLHRQEESDSYGQTAAATGVTDPHGKFKIGQVPPGDLLIYYPFPQSAADAANVGAAMQVTLADGQDLRGVDLDVSKSVSVAAGRVLDTNGLPVRGARVNLIWKFPKGGSTYSVGQWPFDAVLTDGAGRYRLDKRSPGLWTLRASAAATAEVESAPVDFSAAPAAVPDLIVPVVQDDGWVRRVQPMNVQDTVNEWAAAVLAGDKQGERLLENNGSPMWENGERLGQLLKQHIEEFKSIYDGQSQGSYTTGELDMGGGRRGKIVIELVKEQSNWQFYDDDGHFAADPDRNNSYWQITDATEENGKSLLTGDSAKDDPPVGYGRVVDLQRRPIGGARIGSDTVDWSAETAADGTFLWQDRAGLREVHVQAAGFLDRKAYMPDLRNRRVIHMQRGCRLEGRVLGGDGKPLAGAAVGVRNYPNHEGYSDYFQNGTTSDQQGRFVINNVPPEKSFLFAVAKHKGGIQFGFAPLAEAGDENPPVPLNAEPATAGRVLTLTDGQVLRDIVLDTSQSTGVAIGRVVDKNGKPISGAEVHLQCQLFPQNAETIYQFHSVLSSPDGRFRLARLPLGPWMLAATIRNANSEPVSVQLSDKPAAVADLVLPVVQTARGWLRRVPPMDTFDTVRAWIDDTRAGDGEGAAALVVPDSPMQHSSERLQPLLKQRLETQLDMGQWNSFRRTGVVWIDGVDLGDRREKITFHLNQSHGVWQISDVTDDKNVSLLTGLDGGKP